MIQLKDIIVITLLQGEGGRLGLGHEEDTCVPSKVQIDTESIYIVNAKCSNSATILISETGVLFACGVNRFSKQCKGTVHQPSKDDYHSDTIDLAWTKRR